MSHQRFPHQPTLSHLLSSESMAEAQIVYGQNLLDMPVLQVVTSLAPPPRTGSVLITRLGVVADEDASLLRELAGIVVIKPYVVLPETSPNGTSHASSGALPSSSLDVEMQRLVKVCADAEIPLIMMPGFGEPAQAGEDIRASFLLEVKRAFARIYTCLLSLVVDAGLSGLVEEVASWINRPVAVETADFKILAAKNMGPTPPSQQQILSEQVSELLNRQHRSQGERINTSYAARPLRIGRRLVMPILFNGVVVGYFSAMVRPTDDTESIGEYLHAAALAAMVDFSQRQREVSVFAVTQKSLLKDLLLGRGLSAADQERLEQNFGFDLCDGLLVFAVQMATGREGKAPQWPEEPYISTEVEGTRVFVIPYSDRKSGRTWQQEAELLTELLKRSCPDLKVQLGAGRLTETTLDLPDSYREARQALIIGSMIHGDKEFVLSYGDLGVKRLLYLMIDHPELDRFYEENLAPLEAYDVEWETELVSTLSVYLSQGANLNSAARALFVHRHTLRYRLEQIAEILNVDIDSQEVLLNLQIAFLIKEMKGKSPS